MKHRNMWALGGGLVALSLPLIAMNVRSSHLLAESKIRGDSLALLVAAQPKPRPDTATVSIQGGIRIGNPRAKTVIVEYTDYECPFCRDFAEGPFEELLAAVKQDSTIQVVIKDFPLPMHSYATAVAEGGRCAREQGEAEFLRFHSAAFREQQRIAEQQFSESVATAVGLNAKLFVLCLGKGRAKTDVMANVREAMEARLDGTPAFVVGRLTTDGRVHGKVLFGVQRFRDLRDKATEGF